MFWISKHGSKEGVSLLQKNGRREYKYSSLLQKHNIHVAAKCSLRPRHTQE